MVSFYCIQLVYPNYCRTVTCIIHIIYTQRNLSNTQWLCVLNSYKVLLLSLFPVTERAFFSYWFDLTTFFFSFISYDCILNMSAFLYSGLIMYQLLFVLFSVVWVPLFPYRVSRLVTFIIHVFSPVSTILAWEGLFSVLPSSWKHSHYSCCHFPFHWWNLVTFAHGSVIRPSWLKSMYLEIEASEMTSEQKMYHSLLLILWTSHLPHPSAGSRSPCFCLT